MRAPANCSKAARRSSKCRRSSMRRVLRPAAPIWERSTFDVAALSRRHGRRHRLPAAQPPGPHGRRADRQGRRHQVFKKIGDRVEQGEPLYRIYAFDQSEFDLAAGRGKSELRLHDRWRRSAIGETTPLSTASPSIACRRRQQMPRGSPCAWAFPLHEIDRASLSRRGTCA